VIVTLQAESESKTTIGEAQGSDAFDNIEESASLWYSAEPKSAARALNISMIVLDVAGHWLEGSEYAHWREDFIPIQLEPPSLLQDRILDALSRSGHQVDALVTFCDSYQVPVAQLQSN
jgi:hypothetical protein